MGDFNVYPEVQGTNSIAAVGDATVIAAQGASTKIHIVGMSITVYVALATAVIKVEDGAGGTVIAQVDGATVGTHNFYWGERGYIMTANTLLNLTNETANASARVTAVGYTEKRV